MPMKTGVSERWVWWHATGELTDAEIDAACDELARFYDAAREPCVGVIITQRSVVPSARRRRRLAEIANSEGRKHLRGLALVLDSPLARGAVTAVNCLTTRTVPESTFATADEAFDWLRERLPGPYVRTMRNDWEVRVPAEWRAGVTRAR